MKEEGKGLSRKDTFHYLVISKNGVTGKSFTKEELQADSALSIAIRANDMGITISACIFYLLHNTDTMTRLAAEIRGSFSSEEEICNPKLGSRSYLSSYVDETLRMNYPKPSMLRREVLKGGLTIDNRPKASMLEHRSTSCIETLPSSPILRPLN